MRFVHLSAADIGVREDKLEKGLGFLLRGGRLEKPLAFGGWA